MNIDEILDQFYNHCIICPKIDEHIPVDEKEYHIANEMKFQSDFLIYEKFGDGDQGQLCCDMIGCDFKIKFKIKYIIEEVE